MIGAQLTLEALGQGGETFEEKELRLWGELKGLNAVSMFPYTDIEQWAIRVSDPEVVTGKFLTRTRCEVKNGHTEFTAAHKLNSSTNERICTSAEFEFLKAAAVSGQKKRRFTIPTKVPGLNWELDVYYKDKKTFFKYVSLELEYSGSLVSDPALPFGFVKHFDQRTLSPEQDKVLRGWYDKYFNTTLK